LNTHAEYDKADAYQQGIHGRTQHHIAVDGCNVVSLLICFPESHEIHLTTGATLALTRGRTLPVARLTCQAAGVQ